MAEPGLELRSPDPAGLHPPAHAGFTVRLLPASSSGCQAGGALVRWPEPWRMSLRIPPTRCWPLAGFHATAEAPSLPLTPATSKCVCSEKRRWVHLRLSLGRVWGLASPAAEGTRQSPKAAS